MGAAPARRSRHYHFQLSRMPGVSSVFNFYRTALFCRNLGILLGSE